MHKTSTFKKVRPSSPNAVSHSGFTATAQVDNRSSAAQLRALHKVIASSPRQAMQRQLGFGGRRPVLQAQWNMNQVEQLLRAGAAGQAALDRIRDGEISIHKQTANAEFYGFEVQNGQVVPRASTTKIRGFGEANDIFITGEITPVKAAAMIVHESTHSIQKQPGGMSAVWCENGRNKLPRLSAFEHEVQMEIEAHVNEFQFELENNSLSAEAQSCRVNGQGPIDRNLVEAYVRRVYQLPGQLSALEKQAKDSTMNARKAAKDDFKLDNEESYIWYDYGRHL